MKRAPLVYWTTTLCATAAFAVPACSKDTTDGSKIQVDSGTSSGTGGSGGGGLNTQEGGFAATGSGAGSGDGGGADCGATNLGSAHTWVNVLIVLDKSGSMNTTPSGGTQSLWSSVTSALGSAVNNTPNVAFGLELYPQMTGTNQCEMPTGNTMDVPITAETSSASAIATKLGASTPAGGTPTAAALRRARDYFLNGAGKNLTGGKYVLLATDGGPNCDAAAFPSGCVASECTTNLDGTCPSAVTSQSPPNDTCCIAAAADQCLDTAATLQAVQDLLAAGIQTFVVGLPGTTAYSSVLTQLAAAGDPVSQTDGGTPRSYYDVQSGDASALTQTFQSITTSLVTTCEIKLVGSVPDPNQLAVLIDGKEIAKDNPGGGWMLDSPTAPTMITILGSDCATLESKGASSLAIKYGCAFIPPPQ